VRLPALPPQATRNKQPPTSRNAKQQLSSLLRFGAANTTVPSSMAGSTNHIAYLRIGMTTKLGRREEAAWPAVVMVNVVLTVLVFGVGEGGLKLQPARFGSPRHENFTGSSQN
jgi:hypothetical protein